jgi:tRNA pseudouridine32 synthase / 23S rRNA pseudouridine746 synthase
MTFQTQRLSDNVFNCNASSDIDNQIINYWYEGYCPNTGKLLGLPRTHQIEAIARDLMNSLAEDPIFSREGKMYGVLLVETQQGNQVLKAFSGLLQGQSEKEGWVPPISGKEKLVLAENQTLAELEQIKQQILQWQFIPERQEYESLYQDFSQHLADLNLIHSQRKEERKKQRECLLSNPQNEALAYQLNELQEQSKRDGMEKRRLKRQRDGLLKPLQMVIQEADQKIQQLKQQRKMRSRQLQTQMHCTYSLTNFAGNSLSLKQLMPQGLPTGTGECCAPKLLHYAATQGFKPVAMAEFWWGSGSKEQGKFYGACAERCQPIMGFLLSGLSKFDNIPKISDYSLPIIYEDEWLVAIAKPAGLLSVPGRHSEKGDSALSRLRNLLADGMNLRPVHRLDQDTSGILLFARDLESYRSLSRQFERV